MEKRIILLITLMLLGLSSIVNAEESKVPQTPQKRHIVFEKNGADIKKHRMPARVSEIECYYCDGYIYVSFDQPEGNATLSVEDLCTSYRAIYSFSTLSPFIINIGETSGILQLEISTSDGNNYIGYLTE